MGNLEEAVKNMLDKERRENEGLRSTMADILLKIQAQEREMEKTRHQEKSTSAKEDEATKKRIQELEKALQKNLAEKEDAIKQELDKLREEIRRTADAAQKRDLEDRVIRIEEEQERLRAENEARLQVLREQQEIMGHPSLAEFYRSVQNKLQQLLLGCKVVASGLVEGADFTAGQKALGYLQLAGEAIPIPGGEIISVIATGIKIGAGKVNENRAERNAALVVSMRELDELTELTARRLSQIYEEQLRFIPSESAWLLGESAVKEIVALLWSSEGIADPALQGESEVERIGRVFVGHVSRIESEVATQQQGQTMMGKVNGRFAKLARKVWDKVNQPFTFNTSIPTTTKEKWTADGIFHRSGIVVTEGERNSWYSGGLTRPEEYGYRRGTKEEATRAGLDPTRDRVQTKVKEASASKAIKVQMKNVGQATQNNEEKVERLGAQLRAERAAREEQERRLAQLEKALAAQQQKPVSPLKVIRSLQAEGSLSEVQANTLKDLIIQKDSAVITFIESMADDPKGLVDELLGLLKRRNRTS